MELFQRESVGNSDPPSSPYRPFNAAGHQDAKAQGTKEAALLIQSKNVTQRLGGALLTSHFSDRRGSSLGSVQGLKRRQKQEDGAVFETYQGVSSGDVGGAVEEVERRR